MCVLTLAQYSQDVPVPFEASYFSYINDFSIKIIQNDYKQYHFMEIRRGCTFLNAVTHFPPVSRPKSVFLNLIL